MTTVADAVVARLREWGATRVFGYAGDGIDPLLGALRRTDGAVEFVQARHEEAAAFMAVGHAKYTGGLGVVLTTQGPGAIHALTGLYDAKLDSVPVLAIVGQVASTALGSGYLQEVDLPVVLKDVCAQYVQVVHAAEQLPQVLDNAVRTALATSGPTALVLPHDVQQAEAPEETPHEHGVVPSAPVLSFPRALPQEADVRRAAEVLAAGERPALLVGRGAAGAADEVLAVADALGAGITTSLLGKPLLDEGLPHSTGVMGHLGTTASAELMDRCDTLLIVGSNDPWTEFYPAPGQARAVQVELAARTVGSKYPVEVALVGDARESLRALLPLLPDRGRTAWREEVEASVRRWREIAEERALRSNAHPLDPQRVVHELSARLPADAQVAVDVGSSTYWYARHLRLPPGVPAHVSGTLACMGCALPYGIAAKLADPSRLVVALAGDGAMQMSGMAELITVASRWRDWADPRFAVLVIDNRDLAEVSWEQREMEGEPRWEVSQALPEVDYAGYAELLGLRGLRVERPEDVGAAWDAALSADRPVVLQAVCDRDVPLLPPHLPDKAERMAAALRAEADPGSALAQLRVQSEQESGPTQ